MYHEILTKTFEEAKADLFDSLITSNSLRLVSTYTTKKGSITSYSNRSDVAVVYDVVQHLPIIMVERVPLDALTNPSTVEAEVRNELVDDKYVATVSVSSDGYYLDITVVRRDTYETFTKEI